MTEAAGPDPGGFFLFGPQLVPAQDPAGCLVEIGDSAGDLALPEVMWHHNGTDCFRAWLPERVVELDAGERHRPQGLAGAGHEEQRKRADGSGSHGIA
jgi:hypothetical protein